MVLDCLCFGGSQTPLFQITSCHLLVAAAVDGRLRKNVGAIISPSFRATPSEGRRKEADAVEIGREDRFHARIKQLFHCPSINRCNPVPFVSASQRPEGTHQPAGNTLLLFDGGTYFARISTVRFHAGYLFFRAPRTWTTHSSKRGV